MSCRNFQLIIFILFQANLVHTDCSINPLTVNPLISDQNLKILYPDTRTRMVHLKTDEEIFISCPGSQLIHEGVSIGLYITAKCLDQEEFTYNDQPISFRSLRCATQPQDTIRYTHTSCSTGGEEIEIGYKITDEHFIRQIRVCFDNVIYTPRMEQHTLTHNNAQRAMTPRKFFEDDGFYATLQPVDYLYRRDVARRTVNGQVGLREDETRYIQDGNDKFINRGHLAPKGDFVYAFEQLATFHYVNSAPQWASINGGNWNELEISVRDLALARGTDLEIYTGVHDVCLLPDDRTKQKERIYFHTISNKYLMPVPRFYWKMIHDTTNNKAIVVVTVNNAYETNFPDDILCNDISDRVQWFNNKLKYQKTNLQLGYTYACDVDTLCKRANICLGIEAEPLLSVNT